jgi:hypothetical protein
MSLDGLTEKDRRRFEKRLRRDAKTGCLEFTGYRDMNGYGRFGVRRVPRLAHRVAFVLAGNPLAEGENLRHACDNPSCCNPDHLAVGGQDKKHERHGEKGAWPKE